MEESIRVCIAYNPPANSDYCNKDIYEEISTHIIKHSCTTSQILLIGDFNSRTGEILEYEEPDNMDENFIPRELIPSKRKNCDRGINQMGEKLIDLCKGHDLQILNGRKTGDLEGKFTFYNSRDGASSIDIAVASDPLYTFIKSFVVLRQDEISQHCKIVVRIKNLKEDIPTETDDEDS